MRDLLTGRNVRLTAIRDSDVEAIEAWFNDVQFLRSYDVVPAIPRQPTEVRKMLQGFSDSGERIIFAIRAIETDQIIGISGFDEIIWSNGAAALFIGIGDKRYIAKGFGRESIRLLLDFGFNELNFYRIQLNVISYNGPAIRLYESLGFIKEGIFRKFIQRDGDRYDLYLYGLLKEEWQTLSRFYI